MGYQAINLRITETLPLAYEDQVNEFFKIEEQEGFEATGLSKTELIEKRLQNWNRKPF